MEFRVYEKAGNTTLQDKDRNSWVPGLGYGLELKIERLDIRFVGDATE